MKINLLSKFYQNKCLKINKNERKLNNIPVSYKELPRVTAYYLPFCAGKSLDLKQTVEQLQKFNNAFPPDIENLALQTINSGNADNKKLVDIHKIKYSALRECDSLDEIKTLYPEFSDVKTIDELETKPVKGTLIDRFQKGEIKASDGSLLLNPERDLSMQLIQMYWGDCLSTRDIAKECGHDFNSTMEKLGIPRVKSIYGQYLKLSDEESHNAIIEAGRRNRSISEKRLKRKGVPLTDEHKRKISEALKKYHLLHKTIELYTTVEDEEYFNENPYQGEIFTEVLKRAWSYHESKSVKKALSKFMKRPEKEIDEKTITNSNNAGKLKEFWSKNGWAKEKWSAVMKKSWKKQKMLEKMGVIYEPKCYLPSAGKDLLLKLAEAMKYSDSEFSDYSADDIAKMLYITVPDDNEESLKGKPYTSKVLRKFFSDLDIRTNYINRYLTMLHAFKSILENEIAQLNSFNFSKTSYKNQLEKSLREVSDAINTNKFNEYAQKKDSESLVTVFDIYCKVASLCFDCKSEELITLFRMVYNETLDKKLQTGMVNKIANEISEKYHKYCMQSIYKKDDKYPC